MDTNDVCKCEVCQKHAPFYPWIIKPVLKNDGFGHPKRLIAFFENYQACSDWILRHNINPVYSMFPLTHEQVIQLYRGDKVT